jgi:hypothetical protein
MGCGVMKNCGRAGFYLESFPCILKTIKRFIVNNIKSTFHAGKTDKIHISWR